MAAFDHQHAVTAEQLRDTPSRADGVTLEDETKLRAEFSAFLADVGQECHISVFAIYTASVYFHMFYVRQSFRRFNTEDMVLACLLLSSKVMDTKRRMNDILDAYYKIKALHTKNFVVPVKESEPYDTARQRVYDREYDLIATIEFNFTVHRPYDLLANKLKEIFGPKFANESEAAVQRIISEPGNLYQASWFYVNDSCRTPLALMHNADVLSTLAIHLAIMHKKVVVRNHKVPAGQPHKPWHEELYKMDLKFLEELGLQLLEQIKKKNDKAKMDKMAADKMGKSADKLQSQKKRKAPDGEIESSTGGTLTQALEPGQIATSGSSSSSSNSSNAMVTSGDHKKEHRRHDHHHKHRGKGHHGGHGGHGNSHGQGHGQHGQQSQGQHSGQTQQQQPGQQQGHGQGQQQHRKSGSTGHGGHKHDKHGSGHKKNKHLHHGHGHNRPHKPTSHSNPPPPGTHPSGSQGSHKAHRERGSGDRRHNKRQRIGEPGKPPQHQERLVHVDPDGSTHSLSDVKGSDSFPLSNATGGSVSAGQMQSQSAPSAVSSDSASAMVVDSVAGLLSAANASTLVDSTLPNAINAGSISANGNSSAAASTSTQSSVMENKGEGSSVLSLLSQTESAGSSSSNSNSTGSVAMTDEKSGAFEVEMEEGEIGSGSESDGGDDHSRSRSRSMSPEPLMAEMQDGETKMSDDTSLNSAAGHGVPTDDTSEPFDGRSSSMPNGDPSTPETFMPDLGGEEKAPSFVLAPPSSEPTPVAAAASAVEAVLLSAPEGAAQAAEMLYDSNGSNGNGHHDHDGHMNGHANGNGHHMNGNGDTNGHHAMDEGVPVPRTRDAGWQGSPTKDKQQQPVAIQEIAEQGSGLVNHEPELAEFDKAVHANGLLNGHATNGHGPIEGPEAVQPPKQPPLDQPAQA